MGIDLTYQRIQPDELIDLQLHPEKADDFFGWNLDLDDDEVLDRYVDALESDDRYFTLDKWWRAIYFLLNGELYGNLDQNDMDSPFHVVIKGGTAMEINASFDPIRYFTPNEIVEISDALGKIPTDQIRSRLDTLVSNLQVNSYSSRDVEQCKKDYEQLLLDLYNKLISFFAEAVKYDEVILVYFE